MSSKFIRAEDGEIHIVFTSQEAHVLINLTEQILELLGDGAVNSEIDIDPIFQMMGLGSSMDMGGSEQPPEDPVLRRLLPNAYKDEKSASEFRRYTEHGLREKKRAHALTVYEALIPQDEDWNADQPIDRGSIEIKFIDNDAMAWLGALNDLRLALAVRLGISKEFNEGSSPIGETNLDFQPKSDSSDLHKKYELMTESDPMKAVYAVYSWLGWLQQTLLELLMSSGDDHQAT
ncbi:MAG: DUF2017 domain-containing protein [Actinomycetota bacterium]